MKTTRMICKKKRTLSAALCLLCIMISGITGCQKTDAYTRANEYKKQYKDEFARAVESEFGQNYKLKKVEGSVHSCASDYHIMTQYSALRELYGIIENNGKQYHARYDIDTQTLETDYFTDSILSSLVSRLGMDNSKVSYIVGYDYVNERDYFMYPSDVQTILGAARNRRGLVFYIVTSEDLDKLTFSSYEAFCRDNKNVYDVYILSSDNFTDLEHFKKHYRDMTVYPEYATVPEDDRADSLTVDVYTIYNLKGFVDIHQTQDHQEEYNIEVRRLE